MKRIHNNESGLTYTLEAIIGISLIIGTVIFTTGNLQYTAQKTGEHSKVQLMNIGRDTLDLIEVSPVTDIIQGYWEGIVYRNYTLVADKKFVAPGENVTFTVYNLGTDEILYQDLILTKTVLGLDQSTTSIGSIYGSTVRNFSQVGEYNIRAVDGLDNKGNPENNWSNYVTINVGNYYLDTDINGISDNSSKIVEGVVYNSSGFGIPNLTIQILGYQYDPVNSSAAKTLYGRVIEDFENASDWTSDANNKTFNDTYPFFTQGSRSLSLNGTSGFWINRTNSTGYNLSYYDILSFDFFSPTSGERIDIELSKSNTSNKFIWKNISVNEIGWNKINFKLTNSTDNKSLCCHPNYPEIQGTIAATPDADTIDIKVSNITANKDYLFDNLTAGAGRFSFTWPISGPAHTYYIQANDTSDRTSNRHRIVYSNDALIYSDRYIIYETESTDIHLIPGGSLNRFPQQLNDININQKFYNTFDTNKIRLVRLDDYTLNFTANTSGDYYIFVGNSGQGQGQGDPAAGAKTNTILIQVLPIDQPCLLEDCIRCSGFNSTAVNQYARRFIPPYVNYNLYLINPDGTICTICEEFIPIINGYPTDEAVTVNKILHINQQRQDLGYMRELRMVLWYK